MIQGKKIAYTKKSRNSVYTVGIGTRYTFGKYKGLTLAEIHRENPNYIRWCFFNAEKIAFEDHVFQHYNIKGENGEILSCKVKFNDRIDHYAIKPNIKFKLGKNGLKMELYRN